MQIIFDGDQLKTLIGLAHFHKTPGIAGIIAVSAAAVIVAIRMQHKKRRVSRIIGMRLTDAIVDLPHNHFI